MKIRPCIDIHNGKVKQIVGGTLRDGNASLSGAESGSCAQQNFVSGKDAAWYADLYRQKKLSGGHIILLNSASTDPAMYELDRQQALSSLRAYPQGMQVGGGITPQNAGSFLDAGASHVIVTSYVFRDGRLDEKRLAEMLAAVGRKRLVLDLSCRRIGAPFAGENCADEDAPRYAVVTDRWQKLTELILSRRTIEDGLLDRLSRKCDEFLIHAADVEGKRSGIEKPLVAMLGEWQKKSGFPVTYAGGVHAVSDLDEIKRLSSGRMDVTVGSALDIFGGNLSLDALVRRAGS